MEQIAKPTTLVKKNSNQNLVKRLDVTIPNCVLHDKELLNLYNQSDLDFTYVFEKCKMLKPLKGVDVNIQMVEFWFREFLRMGWKKHHFDKQFEAIKRAKLFNRIDLSEWIDTEAMYSENDLEIIVEQRIKALISRGNFLKDKKIELTDEEKKSVDLALAKEYEFKQKRDKFDAIDDYKTERRKLWEARFK